LADGGGQDAWIGLAGLRAAATYPGLAEPAAARTAALAAGCLHAAASILGAWGAATRAAWALRAALAATALHALLLAGFAVAGLAAASPGGGAATLAQAAWLVCGELLLWGSAYLLASTYVHVRQARARPPSAYEAAHEAAQKLRATPGRPPLRRRRPPRCTAPRV